MGLTLPPIPYMDPAVDPKSQIATANWVRWFGLVKDRCDWLSAQGTIDADMITTGTLPDAVVPPIVDSMVSATAGISWNKISKVGSSLAQLDTRSAGDLSSGNLAYARMPSGSGTWTAAPTISGAVALSSTLAVTGNVTASADVTVGGNLMPALTDTSDIGSASKLWRQGYLAQLNAVLFAKETQSLYGGWLAVSKNAGVFAAAVASADTSIDFGTAMVLNQFVLVRGVDTGGAFTSEYFKVGSNVSGTRYNVTRNLSGLGAKNWAMGTAFQVRGVSGDGWVELNAYDTPRLSVWTQGSAYNNSSETIRIGHLTGMPNGSTGIGAYMGDATNYLRWDGTELTVGSGNVVIDSSGISMLPSSAFDFNASNAYRFELPAGSSMGVSGTDRVGGDRYLYLWNSSTTAGDSPFVWITAESTLGSVTADFRADTSEMVLTGALDVAGSGTIRGNFAVFNPGLAQNDFTVTVGTGNTFVRGLLSATGNGAHTFYGTTAGLQSVGVKNSTNGAGAYAELHAINSGGRGIFLRAFSASYSDGVASHFGDGVELLSSFGAMAYVAVDHYFFTNESTGVARMNSSGSLKLGNTTNPAYRLELDTDSAGKPTTSTWTIVSDAAAKENIVPYTGALARLRQVQIRKFDYSGKFGPAEPGVGPVAQEIAAVFPDSVKPRADGAVLTFNPHELFMATTAAVIELDTEVRTVRAQLAGLIQALGRA